MVFPAGKAPLDSPVLRAFPEVQESRAASVPLDSPDQTALQARQDNAVLLGSLEVLEQLDCQGREEQLEHQEPTDFQDQSEHLVCKVHVEPLVYLVQTLVAVLQGLSVLLAQQVRNGFKVEKLSFCILAWYSGISSPPNGVLFVNTRYPRHSWRQRTQRFARLPWSTRCHWLPRTGRTTRSRIPRASGNTWTRRTTRTCRIRRK